VTGFTAFQLKGYSANVEKMKQESEEKLKTREVESGAKEFPVEALAQLWTAKISILDTESG
jgi:hypothetical protein